MSGDVARRPLASLAAMSIECFFLVRGVTAAGDDDRVISAEHNGSQLSENAMSEVCARGEHRLAPEDAALAAVKSWSCSGPTGEVPWVLGEAVGTRGEPHRLWNALYGLGTPRGSHGCAQRCAAAARRRDEGARSLRRDVNLTVRDRLAVTVQLLALPRSTP